MKYVPGEETQRIILKLDKVKELHDRASTPAEKDAAERAMCKLALKALKRTLKANQKVGAYQFQEFGSK